MTITSETYIIPDAISASAISPTGKPNPIETLCALLALEAYTASHEAQCAHERACPHRSTNTYKHAVGVLRATSKAYDRAVLTYSLSVGESRYKCGVMLRNLHRKMDCDNTTRMERIEAQVGRCIQPPTRKPNGLDALRVAFGPMVAYPL